MTRITIAIYNFLKDRKWLMYTLLIASTLVFGWFGMKVEYEENIAKLLPPSESNADGAMAFENIEVKNKIFIQVTRRDGEEDTETIAAICSELVDSLWARDSGKGYIGNILSGLDADDMTNALDYLLEHLPSFVDTSCYAAFNALLTDEALDRQMAENYEIVMNDETGSATTMVSTDPAGLRKAVFSAIGLSDEEGMPGGYALVDGQFFCPDKTVGLIFVAPEFTFLDSKAGNKLVKMIEKEAKAFEKKYPEVEILYHGSPVVSTYNARQIKKDLAKTVGISLLIICILLGICFRNKSTVFLLLAPVAYGALFSLACIWWIKGGMSVMALGIGAIVLGVALSYCLHIVTHYKYVNDPIQVLKDQSKPVFLGVLTTVGAFLGLLFTGSDLLRDFGIFASLAMAGTLVFILIFLPHFFNPKRNRRSRKAFAVLDKINSYPLDKVGWLKWSIVAVCTVSCVFSSRVKFDSDMHHIGYNEPKVNRSRELYEAKNNDGCTSMFYAACADDFDSATVISRQILTKLEELEKDGIVYSYSDLSPVLVDGKTQEERIGRWEEYWSEERLRKVHYGIERAAKKHDLDADMFEPFFAMAEAGYSPCDICGDGVLPEGLISNFVENTAGKWMIFTSVKMPVEHKDDVNAAVDGIKGGVVIDPFWYTTDMAKALNDDFQTVVWISSIFVLIVLLISFRNVLIALTSFMPMALSWFTVNGLMAIFGLEFNLINIVIATFIFGIGVDYSIYVTNGLIDQAKGKGNSLLTYHKTAIFLSAVVLIIVTGSLIFAAHPAINSIGTTTLIGMSATLLITYTLQPALFKWLLKSEKFRKRNGFIGEL
ncbi:MAG: MMPL family transporter [Candidatus Cryptobacteroides sp.]